MVSEHVSAAALVCSGRISIVAELTHSSSFKLVELGLNCQSVQEFDTLIIVDDSRSSLDHRYKNFRMENVHFCVQTTLIMVG